MGEEVGGGGSERQGKDTSCDCRKVARYVVRSQERQLACTPTHRCLQTSESEGRSTEQKEEGGAKPEERRR